MVDLFPFFKGVYFIFTSILICKCSCDPNIEFIALFETSLHASIKDGVIEVKPKENIKIQLFGSNLSNSTEISFAEKGKGKGAPCGSDRSTLVTKIERITDTVAVATISFTVHNFFFILWLLFYFCPSLLASGLLVGGWVLLDWNTFLLYIKAQ